MRLIMLSLVTSLIGIDYCFGQTATNGLQKSRYDSGQVKEMGNLQNGAKQGRWVYYNSNGIIERKEKWKNGVLQWQLFYEKGKIIRTIDKEGKETKRSKCGC